MLKFRAEQMRVIERALEERFVNRLVGHLRDHHADTEVKLPGQTTRLGDLPEPKLRELVCRGIARARTYGLTWESTITAFVAIMFEVAPNFDRMPIARLALRAKIESNLRIDCLLAALSSDDWARAARNYAPQAWES
jgi:hypothetical protein